jgi:MFS family permease
LKDIDIVGSTLFIASITSCLIPITWGGTQFRWDSWHTLVPLILGIAGIVGFILYERYMTTTPFFPHHVFLNYSTSIVYASSFVHGLLLYSLVYYMPEYFQSVQGYSALISGVAALPQTVTVVPCAIFVGVLVGKIGRYRWALRAGWAIATFGFGLLIRLDVNTSIPSWVFLSAVSGIGMGLLFPSIALALQSSVPQVDVAMSATLVLFFRSSGQAVGVAIGGTILENHMQVELQNPSIRALLPPGFQNLGVVALVSVIKTLPHDSVLAILLKTALARSFHVIWATMCGLAGVTLIANLVVKEYDMNQEHVTDQRLRREGAATVPAGSEHHNNRPKE